MDIRTPYYTDTIFRGIEFTIGAKSFLEYVNVLARVFRGKISLAASLPALGILLNHHPKAIILHNEIAAMTHHAMITQNLPQLHDDSSDSDSSRYSASSSNSYGEQLLDMVDHFAGTEGTRPAETHTARAQVMNCLKAAEERERASKRAVMGLATEMDAMGF
jgi:hypothetical protein